MIWIRHIGDYLQAVFRGISLISVITVEELLINQLKKTFLPKPKILQFKIIIILQVYLRLFGYEQNGSDL